MTEYVKDLCGRTVKHHWQSQRPGQIEQCKHSKVGHPNIARCNFYFNNTLNLIQSQIKMLE